MNLQTWLAVATIVGGIAAAIAIAKDLEIWIFAKKQTPEAERERALQKGAYRASLLGGIVASAGATETLHHHQLPHHIPHSSHLPHGTSLHNGAHTVAASNGDMVASNADSLADTATPLTDSVDSFTNSDLVADGTGVLSHVLDAIRSILVH